jgi:hypothetical protein
VREYTLLAELRYPPVCISASRRPVPSAEPQQHQLMLTLKGLPTNIRPRVGELAERLIKHHSAVELINRLRLAGTSGDTVPERPARSAAHANPERRKANTSLSHRLNFARGPCFDRPASGDATSTSNRSMGKKLQPLKARRNDNMLDNDSNGARPVTIGATEHRLGCPIAEPAQFRMVLVSFLAGGNGLLAGLIARCFADWLSPTSLYHRFDRI